MRGKLFSVAAYMQRLQVDKVKAWDDGESAEESKEWELEMVVAVLGAIERKTSSEETGERVFVGRRRECVWTDAGFGQCINWWRVLCCCGCCRTRGRPAFVGDRCCRGN